MEYTPLVSRTSEPAKSYDFQLDAFQKEGIMCIDNLQSVLISAHTSAGKTAVALYVLDYLFGSFIFSNLIGSILFSGQIYIFR